MSYLSDRYDLSGDILADEEDQEGNYLLRHWRGHLSLVQTYWLNGFLTNMVLAGAGLALFAMEKTGRSLRLIAIGFLVFALLFLITRVWTFVGIWRSAGRHGARGGNPAWGVVARVMVGIGLITTLVQLPGLGDQTREYGLIAIGKDPIGPPAAITSEQAGQTIRLAGSISAGIADKFVETLDRMPSAKLVLLDSDGGRIYEALRMANIIRARGLSTRVEEHCASACTLLLLAGKERSAYKLAQIGFHQPDFPGLSERDRAEIVASNRRDYISAGVEQAFVDRAMNTAPNDMWYPDHGTLIEAGVITGSAGTADTDDQKLQQMLQRMERETRAGIGTMVDELTRLDGVQLAGNELRVRYSLTRRFSAAEAKVLEGNLQRNIAQTFCDSSRETLVRMGAEFAFDYADPDGKKVAAVRVNQCKAAAS